MFVAVSLPDFLSFLLRSRLVYFPLFLAVPSCGYFTVAVSGVVMVEDDKNDRIQSLVGTSI